MKHGWLSSDGFAGRGNSWPGRGNNGVQSSRGTVQRRLIGVIRAGRSRSLRNPAGEVDGMRFGRVDDELTSAADATRLRGR
jgi:hypothetical protein